MKKLLALVLALVMTLSLCVVSSNAAYTDAADVDLNEAVDVLSAVGVFQGSDGKFDPKANLTREQAAKLVAYLQIGQKAADALVGGGKFADVAKDRWSAGYVDYCASIGIAAGVGDGKFDPAGSLTALQFGKMLLVCLGYDAAIEGLTGADWTINTSKLMTSAKLLKGLSNVTAYSVVTREQAAQMMLNALKAPMVEYENKGSSIAVNGATIDFGASKAEYVTATVAEDSSVKNIGQGTLTNTGAYTVELGEKLFSNLKLVPGATDAFERPATVWTLKTKTIGTYAKTPDLTYTAATKVGTIYADLGLSKAIPAANTTVYEDGRLAGNYGGVDHSAWTTWDIVKGDITNKYGGKGVLTEVYYDDDDNTVIIVCVNTYIGKVAAAYPDSTTKDAYVKVKNLDGYLCPGAGKEYKTESFKKDDVVRYTYSYKIGEDCIESMELAEKVTGAMSTYTISGNVTVGGTKYTANVKSVTTVKDTVAAVDKGDDVTIYLDANGYVLYVDADADVKYAVVLNYLATAGDFNNTEKAKLLFTDGSTKTVEVALGKNADNSQLTVGATAFAGNNTETYDANKLSRYDIVGYTIGTDEVYTLTLVSDATETALVVGDTELVTNGKNNFANNTVTLNADVNLMKDVDSTNCGDAETIFLVMTEGTGGKKDTFAAYKGFANVPTITLANGEKTIMSVFMDADTDDKPATVVFILDNDNVTVSSNNKDIIYIKGSDTDKSYTTALGHFYEYDCFINGEATTIKSDAPINTDTLIYGPSYNSKGILIDQDEYVTTTGHTSDSHMAYGTKTDAVKNEVIKLGTTSYAYEKDCEVYFIDVDGKLVPGSIDEIAYDEDDLVFVKTNIDGRLTDVYIKVVDGTEVITPAVTAAVYGTPVVSIASGTVKTAGNSLSMHNADHTANVSAKNVVVTYAISTWNPSTNSFNAPMVVSKTVGDVAAGTWIDADGAPVTTGIAAHVTCKVVVTLTSDVASKTFPEQIISST